jgi:RNA:NAD 2'-phosphotransferase (TPT1/KptA family)
LLGFLTKQEWTKYYAYCKYFEAENARDDRYSEAIRYSRALSGILRHNSLLQGSGDQRNAVEIREFNNHFTIFTTPKEIFKIVACVAMNSKGRFFFKIEDIGRSPTRLRIVIGAHQGHTVRSSVFDPSTTGVELRELLARNQVTKLVHFGPIYHITPAQNETSIRRMGLLANTQEINSRGRLAVHFNHTPPWSCLIEENNQPIEGTSYGSYEGRIAVFQLQAEQFYQDDSSRCLYRTENAVILYYGNVSSKYLHPVGFFPGIQSAEFKEWIGGLRQRYTTEVWHTDDDETQER